LRIFLLPPNLTIFAPFVCCWLQKDWMVWKENKGKCEFWKDKSNLWLSKTIRQKWLFRGKMQTSVMSLHYLMIQLGSLGGPSTKRTPKTNVKITKLSDCDRQVEAAVRPKKSDLKCDQQVLSDNIMNLGFFCLTTRPARADGHDAGPVLARLLSVSRGIYRHMLSIHTCTHMVYILYSHIHDTQGCKRPSSEACTVGARLLSVLRCTYSHIQYVRTYTSKHKTYMTCIHIIHKDNKDHEACAVVAQL